MAEECVALCDYVGADGELSFRKGEIITVLAKGTDSGFWEGATQGNKKQRGLFPNCMVTSNLNIQRCTKCFLNKAVTLFDYHARSNAEMSFSKHDVITAIKPSENAGWWLGVNETQRFKVNHELANSSTTSFPLDENNNDTNTNNNNEHSIHVAIANKKTAPKNAAQIAAQYFHFETETQEEKDKWVKLFPVNFVTCNIVVAAYPFQGRQRHELSLAVGDVVMVHRKWNDGWWEGSLPVDVTTNTSVAAPPPLSANGDAPIVVGGRRRGIFPSNYTLPNVPVTENFSPLFCSKCRAVLPTGPLSGECKECNKNEEIVRTMMRTLQEHDDDDENEDHNNNHHQGDATTIDLFEHIDLDPRKGPGALLSVHDVKDSLTVNVRPRGGNGDDSHHHS